MENKYLCSADIIISRESGKVNRQQEKTAKSAWTEHKARSVKVANKMLSLADYIEREAWKASNADEQGKAEIELTRADYYRKRSYRMRNCSTFIKVNVCPDCGRSEGSSVSLCRDRVCPTCQWRLSAKQAIEMLNTLAYVDDLEEYTACFLTLTVKNCKPDQLRATLDMMSEAFNRMNSGRKWKTFVKGTARSLEITYNAKTRTFHPHYHIIMLLEDAPALAEMQTFFNKEWKRCAHLNYCPITDVRYIENRDITSGEAEQERYKKAILETFKYTIKDDNLAEMALSEFRYYIEAIQGKRLVAYTGVIKDARKVLAFTDELEEEESDYKICPECNGQMMSAVFEWSFRENTYKRFEDAIKAG